MHYSLDIEVQSVHYCVTVQPTWSRLRSSTLHARKQGLQEGYNRLLSVSTQQVRATLRVCSFFPSSPTVSNTRGPTHPSLLPIPTGPLPLSELVSWISGRSKFSALRFIYSCLFFVCIIPVMPVVLKMSVYRVISSITLQPPFLPSSPSTSVTPPSPPPHQFTVFVHVWDCIFLSLYVYVYHSALRSWQERDFWRRILLPRWRLISLYRPLSRSRSRPYDRGTSPDRKRLARLVRLSLRPEPGSPSVHPGPTQSPLAVLTAASSSSLVPWSREAESSM